MKFSKYKLIFMIFSLLLTVAFYVITFSGLGGFAHSITFDGGVRLSMLMPADKNKDELTSLLKESELSDVQIRLVNLKNNQYDFEFGPATQAKIKERLESEASSPGANSVDGEKRTVVDEIEKIILKLMPFVKETDVISREAISASYGANLSRIAVYSLLWVIGVIGLYLSFRFDFPFAIGASMALLHDVVLTVGFIGIMQIEPSIPVVAAVLTIIGYSINDTIVIFDRIRENRDVRSYSSIEDTMDRAINQTLSRTVITSLLTLLAVVALLLGGAETLRDFSLVLIFGVVIGTYSSIFIASHFVQYYEIFRSRNA